MPEIGMPRNEFVDALREKVDERSCNLMPDQIREIAEKFDQEVIGSGAECVVVPGKDIGTTETVSAYTYFNMNPLRMKEIFYSHRIFSSLFPHNFPHFYATFGKHPDHDTDPHGQDNISGTIRQRIRRTEQKENEVILFPLSEVEKICREIGLPLRAEIGPHNVIVGEDGGEYFVDTVDQLHPGYIDKEKLLSYMREQNMSDTDIHIVQISIERLTEIWKDILVQKEEKNRKRQECLLNPTPEDIARNERIRLLIEKMNSGSTGGPMNHAEEDIVREV